MPDIVVLLPGILGSVLQKDGKDVWAISSQSLVSVLRAPRSSILALMLKDDDPDRDDLDDGIRASQVVSDAHLVPGLWKIDGYSGLSQFLQETFDLRVNENFFEFPYDWRRDNRVAARRLELASHAWLSSWRKRSGNRHAKLLLVAHSMGGLVARYFLECLEGWRVTKSLVTLGTPYRGSLNALDTLANGLKLESWSDVFRSFTSVYQLLPRYPCFDPGSRTLVRIGETSGIPHVDAGKAARALRFHHDIDLAIDRHLRDSTYRRSLAIHPIVGNYQRTLQVARLVGSHVELLAAYPNEMWDGDGTVPQVSAIPIELDNAGNEMYVAQLHSSLQNTPAVRNQLVQVLSKGNWGGYRQAEMLSSPKISVQVQWAYDPELPVTIKASCSQEGGALTSKITNIATPSEVAICALKLNSEGQYVGEQSRLPEGIYRVTTTCQGTSASVTDVFLVMATV